jgi:type II secretory pathway component PulJ
MSNNKFQIKFNKGFTLIEVIVSVFAFTLIVFGLIALVSNIFTSSNQQSNLLADSDQARRLAFSVTNELRNAQTASTGAYPLVTALAQEIAFYSNIESSAGIEKVRYFVSNGKLWKGITRYNGSSYPTASEETFEVQKNVANGTNPIFYYYDGAYAGGSAQVPLAQPVNVTQVKFVKIKLDVFNKAGVINTNYYTVTSSGTVRNLKTNLGE